MLEIIRMFSGNTLLKNYLKLFSIDVLAKASGIILLPVYLKLMTQDEFGLFGYIVAIVSTFSLVLNLGLYTAQSKLYHDYGPEKRGEAVFTINVILFSFLVCVILISLLFDVDYLLIDFFFKNDFGYQRYRIFILLGMIISVYSLMVTNYFVTSEDFRKVQLFNTLRIVLINTVVLAILLFSPGDDRAFTRIKFTYIVEAAILTFFLVLYLRKARGRFDKSIALTSVRIAFPIFFSSFLGIFINLSDRFAIERYGDLKDMSVYNVSMAVAGIIPFVFAAFQNVWLPHLLKEKDHQINRARTHRMILRLLLVFFLVSVAIMAGLQIMLLMNIVDTKYQDIMPLLPIVLTATIVTSITHMYSNQLISLDKLHHLIIAGVPISILAVALNLTLVRAFNIYGAAASSLIVNACYLVWYSAAVRYYYRRIDL